MRTRIRNKLIASGIVRGDNANGRSCVLMYHGIDAVENTRYNVRFFGRANFEKHIAFFKRKYHVVPLADLIDQRGLVNDRLNVAITFDDGYRNNLTHALPILERYECPATFFITGLNTLNEEILWADLLDLCSPSIRASSISFNGLEFPTGIDGRFSELRAYIREQHFMGTDLFAALKQELLTKSGIDLRAPELQEYFVLLSDEEIGTVARSRFVRVGSHGMYHNNLGNMELPDALAEIQRSKTYLENLTQYTVDSIGYPDGSYTPALREAARAIGFTYQCAVDYRDGSDPQATYLTDRMGLYPPSTVHSIDYTAKQHGR